MFAPDIYDGENELENYLAPCAASHAQRKTSKRTANRSRGRLSLSVNHRVIGIQIDAMIVTVDLLVNHLKSNLVTFHRVFIQSFDF